MPLCEIVVLNEYIFCTDVNHTPRPVWLASRMRVLFGSVHNTGRWMGLFLSAEANQNGDKNKRAISVGVYMRMVSVNYCLSVCVLGRGI